MKWAVIFALAVMVGCKTNGVQVSENKPEEFKPVFAPGPKVLVYKTKADYHMLVPVDLTEDKQQVLSYPHPMDLKSGEQLMMPVKLQNGYLYDQRGIGPNTAFLNMPYNEYAALAEPPSPNDLLQKIRDNDPLTELYDCGIRTAFTDPEKQLNELISSGRLRTVCRQLK